MNWSTLRRTAMAPFEAQQGSSTACWLLSTVLLFGAGAMPAQSSTADDKVHPKEGQQAPPVQKEVITVTADRLPDETQSTPFSVTTIGEAELRDAPQLRIDDVLRNAVPGFSLYRRSSSRVANPSVQGVTLRSLGPNGASRTLVLFDGIPLNDPFAGWVPWSRVPKIGLQQAVVTAGGGAGLFGNAALAGTINFLTPESGKTSAIEAFRGEVTAGDHGTIETSFNARGAIGSVIASSFLNAFATSGYPVLRADQRGPVDDNARLSSVVWFGRLHWSVSGLTDLSVSGAASDEDRRDGTAYTRNSNGGEDLSFSVDRRVPEAAAALRVQGYVQQRRSSSNFSSTNAARTVETPAVDQYAVPTHAVGGSAVWTQQQAKSGRFTVGTDVRVIDGETREHYRFVTDVFTRDRRAGGRQALYGLFAEKHWQPSAALDVVAGARLDYWTHRNGRRRERDLLTNDVVLNVELPNSRGLSPNGRIGASLRVGESSHARFAVYSGFRAPTLNELYRPFRVGNDITEANEGLVPERLYGAESGLTGTYTRFDYSITGFYGQLRNAVGNVTIGVGPGNFDIVGFVPAGVVLRRRQNLDRVDSWGLETGISWDVAANWKMRLQYLYAKSRVVQTDGAPELEGRLLPQTPEHVAVGAITWTRDRWHLGSQARYVGRQFEDDLNALPLSGFFVVDVSTTRAISEQVSVTLRGENLFDAISEIGRSGTGLVRVGAPRLMSMTFAFRLPRRMKESQ